MESKDVSLGIFGKFPTLCFKNCFKSLFFCLSPLEYWGQTFVLSFPKTFFKLQLFDINIITA